MKTIGVSDAEFDRVLLCAGDLMVVEGNGSPDQIGRVAEWNGELAICCHQNHLIKVRCDPAGVCLPRWLLLWLLSRARPPHGPEQGQFNIGALHPQSLKVASSFVPCGALSGADKGRGSGRFPPGRREICRKKSASRHRVSVRGPSASRSSSVRSRAA